MTYLPTITVNHKDYTYDAGDRERVSTIKTLFDGKNQNNLNTNLFDSQGTGSTSFASNAHTMSITGGQYQILQSKRRMPYFAGKSQVIDMTFMNFGTQANVVKRMGYFSSSTVAPYDTVLDGVFLENDGTTVKFVAYNNGTLSFSIPQANWDLASEFAGYNWDNFGVVGFDFLWLGGTSIRLFIRKDGEFMIAHRVDRAGNFTMPFILSPNQPLRYEVRGAGTGSFTYVCSMVASEGSDGEAGFNGSVSTPLTAGVPSNTMATIGTSYPMKGIRLKATELDRYVLLEDIAMMVNSADNVRREIHLNPTLASAPTWTDVTGYPIQEANGSAVAAITNTVTSPGKVLATGYLSQNNELPTGLFTHDFGTKLGTGITGSRDELWLVVTPITANVTANASINFNVY